MLVHVFEAPATLHECSLDNTQVFPMLQQLNMRDLSCPLWMQCSTFTQQASAEKNAHMLRQRLYMSLHIIGYL